MSESEQHEAMGKALKAMKDSRRNAALLQVMLDDYVRHLRQAADEISSLTREPDKRNKSGVPLVSHVKNLLDTLPASDKMIEHVEEFTAESVRIKELQSQVDQF